MFSRVRNPRGTPLTAPAAFIHLELAAQPTIEERKVGWRLVCYVSDQLGRGGKAIALDCPFVRS
jgi:hypothetical protein